MDINAEAMDWRLLMDESQFAVALRMANPADLVPEGTPIPPTYAESEGGVLRIHGVNRRGCFGTQLNNIKESIQDVVAASSHSSKAFDSVSHKIQDTDQLVMQIKAAMEEQNAGSRQINDALHSMNDSTIEVRNASAEMSAGNQAILEEIQRLQDATEAMKNSMDEMSTGARKINDTGAALSDISDQVKDSIDKIGRQIDQFKV
jgi:methyl-accepting chemotaxis protein